MYKMNPQAVKKAPESDTLILFVVTRIGFKPMACCLEGSCSIQLSYRVVLGQVLSQWPPKLQKKFTFGPTIHGKPRPTMDVKIEESWKEHLKQEFTKPYFLQVVTMLKNEKLGGKTIYPPGSLIFNAFNTTPFDKVKVVLLGQDPYHGPGQAHGLSFSVPKNIAPPPSLINMFRELEQDIGMPIPNHGNLTHWAEQGVLLLNASLTVRANEPMSHSKIGWAEFTDAVIAKVSAGSAHTVFLLWGKFAQEKQPLIDETKHLVLKAAHPSPFSADKGFFGCRHFSKTNAWLVSKGIDPIDWSL
jgi:uracil-DNA glycosylase